MMVLAMISPIEFGVLLLVGWVGYRIVNRCGGVRPASGFLLKTLGVVAVVAGIGVLVSRGHRSLDNDSIVNVDLGEEFHGIDFPEGFERGEFLKGDLFEHDGDRAVRIQSPRTTRFAGSGLIVILGSGLIILGAMLFGRERTRPFAFKALTFLGVGAILFSVVSFFGEPPRAEPIPTRLVQVERNHERVEQGEHRIARRPMRATRARRPSLRPDRPTSDSGAVEDFLPPRAGEIPVSAELAKAETKPAEEVKVVEPRIVEPKFEEPKVEEPKVETPPADVAKAEEKTGAASAAAPVVEATDTPPAAATPAEESKPAEVATPAVAAEAVEAKEEKVVAAEPAAPVEEKHVEAAVPTPTASEKPVAQPVSAAEPSPTPPAAVQPTPTTIIPSQPRPAWVDRAPGLSDGVYAMVVSSGPYVSVPECQRALDEEIRAATNHYIDEYLGDEHAASLVNLPAGYLRDRIKKVEYAEAMESPSVGRMYQLHARLEFDDHARSDFQRQWRHAVVQDRLWYTGGGAALVLALLATFYGYLKLDLKTSAPHKGRLQLAATLVALIVAAGALLARWTVPF